MNARQAKKRAKATFYVGVADAFLNKMYDIQEKVLKGEPVSWSITPATVGFGHNQHGFAKMAKFGKEIVNKFAI